MCQGAGSTFVSGVVGDFFNVVGLPVHKLSIELCNCLTVSNSVVFTVYII